MTAERTIVIGVVAVVVATAVVSGPLVGAVDLTSASDPDTSNVGIGSVDIADVSLPEAGELAAGRFGAETFYLRVPDATVTFQRVIGQPVVTYRLSIPELGLTKESVYFVTEHDAGDYTLTFGETEVEHDEVVADSYVGELSVNARTDGGSRVVANDTILIEVVR